MLMEFIHKTTYPDDVTFTQAERLIITPDLIYRWMCMKVYGDENPSQDESEVRPIVVDGILEEVNLVFYAEPSVLERW